VAAAAVLGLINLEERDLLQGVELRYEQQELEVVEVLDIPAALADLVVAGQTLMEVPAVAADLYLAVVEDHLEILPVLEVLMEVMAAAEVQLEGARKEERLSFTMMEAEHLYQTSEVPYLDQ
jgi:hypothetical protein